MDDRLKGIAEGLVRFGWVYQDGQIVEHKERGFMIITEPSLVAVNDSFLLKIDELANEGFLRGFLCENMEGFDIMRARIGGGGEEYVAGYGCRYVKNGDMAGVGGQTYQEALINCAEAFVLMREASNERLQD